MMKIGITGGIGSGKTTACKMFEQLGVPIYYADERAHWINNNNTEVITRLKALFGEQIYTKKGELDRKQLGSIVFHDKEKLAALNAIVHPAVFADAEQWQTAMKVQGHVYTLKEAALLFEVGSYRFLDKIIVVSAPQALRISRVMQRDNLSEEEVLARIAKQMPQEEKEKLADFVLHNSSLETLQEQVRALHQQLLELTKI